MILYDIHSTTAHRHIILTDSTATSIMFNAVRFYRSKQTASSLYNRSGFHIIVVIFLLLTLFIVVIGQEDLDVGAPRSAELLKLVPAVTPSSYSLNEEKAKGSKWPGWAMLIDCMCQCPLTLSLRSPVNAFSSATEIWIWTRTSDGVIPTLKYWT